MYGVLLAHLFPMGILFLYIWYYCRVLLDAIAFARDPHHLLTPIGPWHFFELRMGSTQWSRVGMLALALFLASGCHAYMATPDLGPSRFFGGMFFYWGMAAMALGVIRVAGNRFTHSISLAVFGTLVGWAPWLAALLMSEYGDQFHILFLLLPFAGILFLSCTLLGVQAFWKDSWFRTHE